MTVSFVGAASAEATSLTLPTHQAGDLLVMLAMRYNNLSPGTIPSGWGPRWVSARSGSFVQNHIDFTYKIAGSSTETSGTWTNWTHLLCAVYRHNTNYIVLNAPYYTRGTGTTITYGQAFVISANAISQNAPNSLANFMSAASGWVIGVASAHLNTSEINVPPSGMTNRASLAGASNGRIALHDTNGGVSSYTAQNVTVTSSTDWITNIAEIIDTGSPKATGGGLILPQTMLGGYTA